MKRVPLWLADGVPFYLISAACMLGGCLAINSSLSWVDAPAIRDIPGQRQIVAGGVVQHTGR